MDLSPVPDVSSIGTQTFVSFGEKKEQNKARKGERIAARSWEKPPGSGKLVYREEKAPDPTWDYGYF